MQCCPDVAHEEYQHASKALDEAKSLVERRVREMFKPLRDEVSRFIGENIEKEDVNTLWKRRVEDEGTDQKREEFSKELLDEVYSRLEEFNSQL